MTAWPQVVDRLVTLLPTLPGWLGVTVYDGPPVTQDAPANYVTVGYVVGEDMAGDYEQTDTAGDLTEESGTVRSEIVCTTGNVDLPSVRARAFQLADAWRAEIRRDGTLGGVLTLGGSSSLAVDVQPAQTTAGSVQRLTVTLSYMSRSSAQ